jgi:hypothetical protein
MNVNSLIRYSAGLSNVVGILIFSKFLTNKKLSKLDSLFDIRGNILIILWGLTYIFTKNTYNNPIMIVFFIEKMLYVFNFIFFDKKIDPKTDFFTKFFIKNYGYIDLIFGVLFVIQYLFKLK